MIGRAYLWGLAQKGETGVENVFDLMNMGPRSALLNMGHTSIDDLSPADYHIPADFEGRLSVSADHVLATRSSHAVASR